MKPRQTGIVAAMLAASIAWTSIACALTQAEIANLSGPDREQVLIEGAKKEGKVVLYSALIAQIVLRPMAEAFQKKYPFIKMEYWRAESEKIIPKVLAERSANSLLADVLEGSGIAVPLIDAKAVQAFHSPGIDASLPQYRDSNHLWAATRISFMGSAYNTKLLKPDQAPKTFEDLLNPALKGKIAWRAGSESGGAQLFITNLRTAWGEEKADAYFQKLSQQKIVNFTASARALVDQVMSGEYAVALDIYMQHARISADQGASVASQPMPIIPSTNGTVMYPLGAPHPYAGMLLIDYMLSPEGAKVLVDVYEIPPDPTVEPKPQLLAHIPRLNGKQENFLPPEALAKYLPQTNAIWEKYFR